MSASGRIAVAVCCLALAGHQASAQVVSGSMEVEWHEGAPDCSSANSPPIQVHAYESRTYILRESLCVSFEAPFLYLLVGAERALLIDSGAIEDSAVAPIGQAVRALVDSHSEGLPLLVVHTHGHRDHRDGDAQFGSDTVVSADLEAVQAYFQFERWPEGEASIDLGGREVVVVPAPGHHPAHLFFYDSRTGLLLTGDHLLSGRLLIFDLDEYRTSTQRLLDLAERVEVTYVVGAHSELDETGYGYLPGSTHHPNERPHHLLPGSIGALSDALRYFNGFYAHHGDFVLVYVRNVALVAIGGVVLLLAALIWSVRAWRYWRA